MINELAKRIHKVNVKNGFYEDEKNIGEMLMLIVSELSEALEADRKGRYCKNKDLITNDKVNPKSDFDKLWKIDFEKKIKDTFEDEIIDTIIRCLDLCAFKGIDIESHIEAKLRYNSLREYKHGKKY